MMRPSHIFNRHPQITLAVFAVVSAAVLILLLELSLRLAGYAPATMSYQVVDRLVVSDSFVGDEAGILLANPRSRSWQEPFHINGDGFRSPEFNPPRQPRKSILLLGDSFAWGASAQPITSSFADLLRQAGYEVYNTGIPSVGPTQMEAIARKYIPRLHPDYVIAAFYLGKMQEKPSPMVPWHNFFYVTNAGWISGFDEHQRPLTAEEAYQHYLVNPKQKIKLFLKQTAVGAALYNLVTSYRYRVQPKTETAAGPQSLSPQDNLVKKYQYTFDCLHHMQELARTGQGQFYTVVIPILGRDCCSPIKVADFVSAFDKLNPIYLTGITDEMYTPSPDCHLTNGGHQFVCDKIIQKLQKSDK